jgi:periplasmic protein TonB
MSFLDTQHKKKSMAITVIIHMILILLLFYVGLSYLDPPLENGIAINFGTMDTGSGKIQPSKKVNTAPKPKVVPLVVKETSEAKEDVITQETMEAPVINKEENNEEVKEVETIAEKEIQGQELEKKIDTKPDKTTTDILSSLINGPKSEGEDEVGEGSDEIGGDKGDSKGTLNAKSYYGTGKSLDGDGNYLLGGRKALNKKKILQDCNEAGIVVVSIEVDRAGNVIDATPGVRGTTNNSKCLLDPAKRAALATKFNKDGKAPFKQIGKIVYRFSLSD